MSRIYGFLAAVSPRPWSTPPIGRRFEIDKAKIGGAIVGARDYPALWLAEFDTDVNVVETPANYGRLIPSPYVSARFSNSYYNTVYAEVPRSVEMLAVGRHFTPAVLDALAAQGTVVTYLTLHTGSKSTPCSRSGTHSATRQPQPLRSDASSGQGRCGDRGPVIWTVMMWVPSAPRCSGGGGRRGTVGWS